MYGSLLNFADELFSNLDQWQRQLESRGAAANIRQVTQNTFPRISLGSTPNSVEVLAFIPDVDTKQLALEIDKNVLTLQGERVITPPSNEERATVYAQERFSGKFKRVVSLPDDVDVNHVNAIYKDGVLRISIARREETLPKRIEIQ
ncbi:Hsp20/alpha crystallin family protein [Thiofilum flexile]|uniref:Hsp20/alpha crystallin family protein n=1 Tax=Thiofilum flexile TaxID=125627 RepID=UPI00036CC246|nr:Hsp20/alpha crystallin family protein [Thiofilum flexile]